MRVVLISRVVLMPKNEPHPSMHNLAAYSRDEAAQALVRGSCWFSLQTTRRMKKSGKVGRSLHLHRCSQLAPQILLPLACSLAPGPLPVGHADDSVAQHMQVASFQQSGTRWRLAARKCQGPSNSTAHTFPILFLSPAFSLMSCTIMSMEIGPPAVSLVKR